jgi:hypothetical protein
MRTIFILFIALCLSACQSGQSKTRDSYSERRQSDLFQLAEGQSQNKDAQIKKFKNEVQTARTPRKNTQPRLVGGQSKRYLDITPMEKTSYKYVGKSHYHKVAFKEKPISNLPKIKNAPNLSKKDIQYLLKKLGYYEGKLDGVIGSKSKAAIKAFQNDAKLKSDGIAGKKTKAHLVAYVRNKMQNEYKSAL